MNPCIVSKKGRCSVLRRSILILTAVVLSSACIAHAAPVGNIAAPAISESLFLTTEDDGAVGFIAGFDVNMISDRKIKDIDDADLNFYTSKLGITINDRVLVYTLLGGANGEAEETILGVKVKYETETAFTWGVGATVILLETEVDGFGDGILRFGGDIKYRHTELDLDKIIIAGTSYTPSDVAITDASFEYGEFQGAIGVSYQVKSFVPYMGVKFTSLDGETKATLLGTEYKSDFDAEESVGMFVGADILLTDSIAFHVEGSLLDEEAVTVGGTIQF